MANITPAEHLDEVLSRYGSSPNPRLAEITTAAIRHLHAFVEEVGLTREEWFVGIQALTEIGHLCDDKRQEFILLSDTLGVSMLVEMINQNGSEGTTEPTVFGSVSCGGRAAAPDGRLPRRRHVRRDLRVRLRARPRGLTLGHHGSMTTLPRARPCPTWASAAGTSSRPKVASMQIAIRCVAHNPATGSKCAGPCFTARIPSRRPVR